MNFKKLLFLIALFSIISCTKDKDKAISALEYQLKSKNLEIDAFKSKSKNLTIELEELKKRYKKFKIECDVENEIILKKIDSFNTFSLNIIMKQRNLFGSLLANLIDKSSGVQDNIHMIRFNDSLFAEIPKTEITYLTFFINNVDRSPATINHFFSEENKKYIYSLFEYTNYYKSTGLKDVIDALLMTYNELENDEILSKEVLVLATDKGLIENHEEYINRFEKVVSTDVKRILKVEEVSDDYYWRVPSRAQWVYTFWIRRHMEGNQDVIVSLLREFKQNLED